MNNIASKNGGNKIFTVGTTRKNSITAATAMSDTTKLTNAKQTFSKGKSTLLMRIFLMGEPSR